MPPHGSVVVADSLVTGDWRAGKEALVYWRRAVAGADGTRRADTIHSLTVPY